MKYKLSSLILVVCIIAASGWQSARAQVAHQIIAREKAAFEAWQQKDKAYWADYLTDDATYFGAMSPYLETDPKVNFIPKLDQHFEQFKMLDFQMYNPRVQVYGDVAVLTYNQAATVDMGGNMMNYTGKVTSVYVKQGNTWRVVHGHESMNPGAQ